jgi:voltage-gated potassium channel
MGKEGTTNVAETAPLSGTMTPFRLFVDAVSLLAIVNIVLLLLPLRQELNEVIAISEVVISIIFFADFLSRWRSAPEKRAYFWAGRGWLDLLTSLPLPGVRILRLIRIVRNARAIRQHGLDPAIRAQLSGSVFYSVLFLTIVTIQFGSLAVLAVETRSAGGNIETGSDAVWWAYVSITTVGYGDQVPVTGAGRMIGVAMLTVGVALFSTFTAFLAQVFFGGRDKLQASVEAELAADVRALRAELSELRALLERRAEGPPTVRSTEAGGLE